MSQHTDTAIFSGDTIVLHAAAASARLSQTVASYVRSMPPFPGLRSESSGGSHVDVYLAPDEKTFSALTGGAAPHWGAGIAQPDSGIIVIPAYTSKRGGVQSLGPVIRHEIAHVELQRTLKNLRIPRWFTEGYAVYASGELDPDGAWYLRIAFLSHRAPPLDSLELDWPAQEMDARVAYLLSATAVAYLHSLGDEAMFTQFLQRWRDTGSMELAMRQTYLMSTTQFETLWSKHVRHSYGWLLFLAQGVVVWAFITVVAIAMIFFRRRRDRLRLEAMRRAEIPDKPAFWIPGAEEEEAGAEAGSAADSEAGPEASSQRTVNDPQNTVNPPSSDDSTG